MYQEEQHAWNNMRVITTKVIDAYKKNGRRSLTLDENNNQDTVATELRKPRLFVNQVFQMANEIDEFDEQCITDEIDTLIAGVRSIFSGETC